MRRSSTPRVSEIPELLDETEQLELVALYERNAAAQARAWRVRLRGSCCANRAPQLALRAAR